MLMENNDRLVFVGDSITDVGRERPVAERQLGDGYVKIVSGLLKGVYPELFVRVFNAGISGDTVRDLKARWETDVMALKPDWVSIMIGINDVWRHFENMPDRHVPLAEYKETLNELVESTKAKVKRVAIIAPFFIEANRNDAMRGMVDEYRHAAMDVAKKNEVIFADPQVAFDDALKSVHPMMLAWDRVHPNFSGHTVIARAFLRAIGFDWNH